MHIVFANQWYPPESGWGGVALYNYAMANAYRALGHEVTVIARGTETGSEERTANGIRIRRLGVTDPYRARRLPLAGRYVRPYQQLRYSWRVRRALEETDRERAIDAVECAEVNAEGFWAARALRLPFTVRCHTPTFVLEKYFQPDEIPYDTRITGACEKDVIRRARALTAPSRDMARVIGEACAIPAGAITVIPNALPGEAWERGDEAGIVRPMHRKTLERYNVLTPITVLYVGRFERVKGIRVLAEAIPAVVKSVPGIRFLLAGYDRPTARGSSMRAEIEKELEQAGAAHAVEFLGAVEQAQLPALYERADVCVVPSLLYESFSYTCAQGMAAGRAVVASRIGGIPETVEEGVTGLLTEPGDAQGLAEAIAELAGDRARCAEMGRAGYERARREFDAVRAAEQTIQVYERARRGNGAAG